MDGVRPDHRARELLDEEVLLHRQPRRGEEADGLRAVLRLDALEPVGRHLQRVLPCRGVELAVLPADERLSEPIRMVHEVEGKSPLDAEVPFVGDVARIGGDLLDPVRLRIDVDVDLTADAAERAGRLDFLQFALRALRALLELLVDGARRADAEAAATELALRVEPGAPPRGDDARLRPTAFEGKRRALHDLLRVADAARAEDAGVGVVPHER